MVSCANLSLLMPKPHIGLITSAIDNRRARGTALVARKYLENLTSYRDKYDITLIHHEPCNDPLYAEFKEVLIPHLPKPFDRQLFREAAFWIGLTFKKELSFDVIHYLHPRIWPSYLLTPSKHIVVSAFEGAHMLKENRHSNENKIFRFTSRFLNYRMHRLTACSESGREEIVATYHVPSSRVTRIYLGVDSTFKPVEVGAGVRNLQKYGVYPPYLLAVSRFDPHKNIHGLLDAYEILLSKHDLPPLVLVGGPHTPGYSEKLIARCNMLREQGASIHVLPYVEDEDMPALYSLAEVLVYPSLHEGFGLPVAEAMACGTPVITTTASSLPEVAGRAALLVPPNDAYALANAVQVVIDDSALREELVSAGKKQAAQFTWERMTEENVAIYDEMLRD